MPRERGAGSSAHGRAPVVRVSPAERPLQSACSRSSSVLTTCAQGPTGHPTFVLTEPVEPLDAIRRWIGQATRPAGPLLDGARSTGPTVRLCGGLCRPRTGALDPSATSVATNGQPWGARTYARPPGGLLRNGRHTETTTVRTCRGSSRMSLTPCSSSACCCLAEAVQQRVTKTGCWLSAASVLL